MGQISKSTNLYAPTVIPKNFFYPYGVIPIMSKIGLDTPPIGPIDKASGGHQGDTHFIADIFFRLNSPRVMQAPALGQRYPRLQFAATHRSAPRQPGLSSLRRLLFVIEFRDSHGFKKKSTLCFAYARLEVARNLARTLKMVHELRNAGLPE